MDILFVDLDGIVIDNFVRAEVARQRVEEQLKALAGLKLRDKTRDDLQKELFYSTEGLYDPKLIEQDTLQPGAVHYIEILEKQFKVIFLTSRPSYTRIATLENLKKHHMLDTSIGGIDSAPDRLVILKPGSLTYTKTTMYKAGTVEMLALAYHAGAVTVVDDDRAVREEAGKIEGPFILRTFSQLHDAANYWKS